MKKNIAVFYIYKILENDSDTEHKLTQKEIVEKLSSEYGIVLERKAVSRLIDALMQIDPNIVKQKRGGIYMEQRTFEPCELFFLLDSVYYDNQLPQKHARQMINKLISLGSISFREQCQKQYEDDIVSRPKSSELLLYLEIVNEAIRDKVKVEITIGEKSIKVCPLGMALKHGQYWLVTFSKSEKNTGESFFPIALIDNIKMTEEKMNISPEERIRNLRLYLRRKDSGYSMLSNMAKVGVKVKNLWAGKFDEMFGKNYFIEKENEKEFIAQVYCEQKQIANWCIENYNYAELVYPECLRKQIIFNLQKCLKRYVGENQEMIFG